VKKRYLLVPATLVAVLGLGGCAFLTPNWGALKPTTSPAPSDSATPSAKPSATPTAHPSLASVSVSVLNASADANGIDVVAQASNISEDGGKCTLTVSQAAVKKTVTASAESNVTDTQCYPLHLPLTGFSSGPATFTVTYTSGSYEGTSAVSSVTIP